MYRLRNIARMIKSRRLRWAGYVAKRDVNGEWRMCPNEELHSLCSPNIVMVIISRRLRLTDHIGRMEERRSVFKILTGTPTRKKSLGRPRHRWKDNIRMDVKQVDERTILEWTLNK